MKALQRSDRIASLEAGLILSIYVEKMHQYRS